MKKLFYISLQNYWINILYMEHPLLILLNVYATKHCKK